MIQSFSKKECPYDNACIESFHAILNKEEVYRVKYFDFESARLRLFEYIEGSKITTEDGLRELEIKALEY